MGENMGFRKYNILINSLKISFMLVMYFNYIYFPLLPQIFPNSPPNKLLLPASCSIFFPLYNPENPICAAHSLGHDQPTRDHTREEK